ncbi:MAG: hypothetical protein OXB84_08580, partial [Halobacteriovoraceae bacterium]|nr:hypothetical protein [Halobacteriovoraceae bacterium]
MRPFFKVLTFISLFLLFIFNAQGQTNADVHRAMAIHHEIMAFQAESNQCNLLSELGPYMIKIVNFHVGEKTSPFKSMMKKEGYNVNFLDSFIQNISENSQDRYSEEDISHFYELTGKLNDYKNLFTFKKMLDETILPEKEMQNTMEDRLAYYF